MLPVVVVHVAAPQGAHAAEMIAACTSGLRRGYCYLAKPGDTDQGDATAVVSWIGHGYRLVHVDVLGGATDADWRERKLEFQPRDAIAERWKVVGLTIATLVGDMQDKRFEEAEVPGPASTPTEDTDELELATPVDAPVTSPQPEPSNIAPVTRPAAAPQPSHPKTTPNSAHQTPAAVTPSPPRIHAVASGLALNPTTPRFGAWARGTLSVAPPISATASLAYSVRPRDEYDVLVAWAGVSIGAGVSPFPTTWPVASRMRLEVLLERVTASIDGPLGNDQQSHAVAALRGGAELLWPSRGRLSVVVSLEGIRYWRPIRVSVVNRPTAVISELTYMFGIGPELRF